MMGSVFSAQIQNRHVIADRILEAPSLPGEYEEVLQRIERLRQLVEDAIPQRGGRWADLLTRMTYARAIYGSNRMAGMDVTLDDAVAAVDGEESPRGPSPGWSALVGYRDALDHIIQLSMGPEQYDISEGTILALHHMMVRHRPQLRPGRWRISEHDRKRPPDHKGPPAEAVPNLMRRFIESLNNDQGREPVVRAAIAHLNLVMIRPFTGSNRRLARALQTMVLAHSGSRNAVFLSIEEYIGNNAQTYATLLEEVGRGPWHSRSALPWLRFCLTAHYVQAATLQRRVAQMLLLVDRFEDYVATKRLPARVVLALIDAANGLQVRNPSYRRHAKVSDQVAKGDLQDLVATGLLEGKGERRWRNYVATPRLRELVRETKPRATELDPFASLDREFSVATAPETLWDESRN